MVTPTRITERHSDIAVPVTRDYDDHREGDRVVSLGEKPYFDPNSKSRREALGQKKRIFGFKVTQ